MKLNLPYDISVVPATDARYGLVYKTARGHVVTKLKLSPPVAIDENKFISFLWIGNAENEARIDHMLVEKTDKLTLIGKIASITVE